MQPDSLIPDPSNPQAWNRYSYVLNNPVRFNDPSGHSVDCGLGDRYCSAGEYKPSALIKLYKENGRYNTKLTEKRDDALAEDIEYYMKRHPEYDPQKDGMTNKSGDTTGMGYDFFYEREKYWTRRAADSGLCSLLFCQGEARKLIAYYDFHQQFEYNKWVWGDPAVITLDVVGIPLGMVGKGIKVGAETPYQILGGSSALTTGVNAGYKNDTLGVVLSRLSPIPVIGSLASAMSLGRDVGRWETIAYVPPISR